MFFGILIDKLSKLSDLSVPWFVAFKAISDITTNYMMFASRPPNFMLAKFGVFLNFFFGKGYFGVIILTLKTVVDDRAANIAVSFALLSVNLNTLIFSSLLGKLEGTYEIADLLLWFSNISQFIVVPIFLAVGWNIRKKTQMAMQMPEETEARQSMLYKMKSLRNNFKETTDFGNNVGESGIDKILKEGLLKEFGLVKTQKQSKSREKNVYDSNTE